MFQLSLAKQGQFRTASFDDRVATLDVAQRCCFLSRKNSLGELCHHKLILHHVRLWPELDTTTVREDFDSLEALLTVEVSGTEVAATEQDRSRVKEAGTTVPQSGQPSACIAMVDPSGAEHQRSEQHSASSDGAADSASSARFSAIIPINSTGTDGGSSAVPDEKGGRKCNWVVRCPNFDALCAFVACLRQMQPPGTASRATRDNSYVGTALPSIVGDLDVIRARLHKLSPDTREQTAPPRNELAF